MSEGRGGKLTTTDRRPRSAPHGLKIYPRPENNTAADAAAREACRRAASAAAAGQRVPSCQKGRGLQLRAWLIVGGASARLLGLKVCVCGPRSRPSAGRLPWRWCGDCGLVARSGRRVLRRLSPVASLWGWVRARCNPMACPGAAWVGLPRVRWWRLGGWGLVGRVTGPSSRAAGNCETCTPGQWHAAARCHSSLTQQASGLFVASVARKPILPL